MTKVTKKADDLARELMVEIDAYAVAKSKFDAVWDDGTDEERHAADKELKHCRSDVAIAIYALLAVKM